MKEFTPDCTDPFPTGLPVPFPTSVGSSSGVGMATCVGLTVILCFCHPTLLLHQPSFPWWAKWKICRRKIPGEGRAAGTPGNPGSRHWQLLKAYCSRIPNPTPYLLLQEAGSKFFGLKTDIGCRSKAGQPLLWSVCWQKGAVIQKSQDVLKWCLHQPRGKGRAPEMRPFS